MYNIKNITILRKLKRCKYMNKTLKILIIFIFVTSCRNVDFVYKELPLNKSEPKFINQSDISYECERYLGYANKLPHFKKRAIEMNNYCKFMDYKTSRFYKNEIIFLKNYNFCIAETHGASNAVPIAIRENKRNFNQEISYGSSDCNSKRTRLVPFELYVRVKEARQLDYITTPTYTMETYQKFLKENKGMVYQPLENKREFKNSFRIDLDDYNRLVFDFKSKTAQKLNYFNDSKPHTYRINTLDDKKIEIQQTYDDFMNAYDDGSCNEECNENFEDRLKESGGRNSIFVKINYNMNEAKLTKVFHPESNSPFTVEKMILKDANSIIDNPKNFLQGAFQTLKNNKSEIVELIFWSALAYLVLDNLNEIQSVTKTKKATPSPVPSTTKTAVNSTWKDNRSTYVYVLRRYRMIGY